MNVLAGVIDPDYTGEIVVVIFNFGEISRTIVQGQRIAQVIFENILNPTVQIVKQLPITSRSDNGFGSTDEQFTLPTSDSTSSELISSLPNKHDKDEETIIPTIKSLKSDLNVSIEMPYNISLSLNPFDNYTHRTLQVKGNHPLLGLSLQICKTRNITQIIECLKSTPAIRIPRWRTEVKHGYIIAVNNNPVQTIDQVKYEITNARNKALTTVDIQIATFEKIAMHPQQGIS